MGKTLVDTEIEAAAEEQGLISPFEPNRLKGASYDFRIGETVIVAHPDGLRGYSLIIQRSFSLQPGQSCIVSSREKIKLPQNMAGRLSLRSFHQLRGLFYSGGLIDPGYNGLLFFPLANITDSPIELVYEDPLATCEFEHLNNQASCKYKGGEEISKPQQTPAVPKRISYSIIEISQRLDEMTSTLSTVNYRFERLEALTAVSQRIQEWIFLAAVGAVVAAAFLSLFAILPLPSRTLVGGAALAALGIVLLLRRKRS